MKKLSLAFLALNLSLAGFLSTPALAATIPAASTSRADVGAAVAAAVDGDTVTIPPGSSSWTNTLTVSKAITIQGSGTNATILLDDIIKGSTDSTHAFFVLQTLSSQFYRLTGIQFARGTRTTHLLGGAVQTTGNSFQIRLDHLFFNQIFNAGIYLSGGTLGCVDNNFWVNTTGHTIAVRNHQLFGGSFGYKSWETPFSPGTAFAWYIEDNAFTGDDSDAFGGGRAVWRFNTFTNSLIHTHGTESSGNYRSHRWLEAYGNVLHHSGTDTREFFDFRDGNGLLVSNVIINTGSAMEMVGLNNYRTKGPYPIWGGADATNPLDTNDVSGGVLESGTATTGTTGTTGAPSRTFTDNTKAWTVNQWQGYTVRNMSSNYPVVYPFTSNYFSQIQSNSATTITYFDHAGTLKMRFAAGNSYEIRRVKIALDQIGSGPSTPFDPKLTNTVSWPNQQPREPLYQWKNTNNGVLLVMSTGQKTIVEGRDFTNNVVNSAWTPYTYPHPLRSGSTATLWTLGVQSSPVSGATISATTDFNGQGAGVTSFSRVYTNGVTATLTAPSSLSSGTYLFSKWQRNGIDFSTSLSTSQNMTNAYTFTAVYTNSVIPGVPTSLAFGQQPTTVAANATISPPMTVRVLDQNGNLLTTATSSITVAIGNNAGGGTLSGTLTKSAVSGIATFNNLSINNGGTNYTLTANSSGLTGTTSTVFNVVSPALPPSKVVFGQQPTTTQTAAILTPSVTVLIQDVNGVLVPTNLTVTVAIGTNPGGGTLSGTVSKAAINGVATFNDLSINNAGVGYTLTAASGVLSGATSSAFDVTAVPPDPPSKVVFGQQPTTTQVGAFITPAVTVLIQDSNGNVISTNLSVTIAIGTNPGGGTLSGTLTVAAVAGVAAFSNLSINNSGNGYTLQATSGALTGATSSTFNVTPLPPSQLIIAQQPTSTFTSFILSPAITVKICDTNGVQTTSTANVTVSIGTNPGGAVLGGTLIRAAVSGLATFNNLSLDKAGVGYTLHFVSGILTPADSSAFTITDQIPVPTAPRGLSAILINENQ